MALNIKKNVSNSSGEFGVLESGPRDMYLNEWKCTSWITMLSIKDARTHIAGLNELVDQAEKEILEREARNERERIARLQGQRAGEENHSRVNSPSV